jgi:hypothetical protein
VASHVNVKIVSFSWLQMTFDCVITSVAKASITV